MSVTSASFSGATRSGEYRARENNRVRLVEVLERDEASLTNIIEGLDAIAADHGQDGDEIDLLALADESSGEAW